jgi:hypothetical protein
LTSYETDFAFRVSCLRVGFEDLKISGLGNDFQQIKPPAVLVQYFYQSEKNISGAQKKHPGNLLVKPG